MDIVIAVAGLALFIVLTHRNAYAQGREHERARALRLASEEVMGWEKALNGKPEANLETEMYWSGARYGVLRLVDKLQEGAP